MITNKNLCSGFAKNQKWHMYKTSVYFGDTLVTYQRFVPLVSVDVVSRLCVRSDKLMLFLNVEFSCLEEV